MPGFPTGANQLLSHTNKEAAIKKLKTHWTAVVLLCAILYILQLFIA